MTYDYKIPETGAWLSREAALRYFRRRTARALAILDIEDYENSTEDPYKWVSHNDMFEIFVRERFQDNSVFQMAINQVGRCRRRESNLIVIEDDDIPILEPSEVIVSESPL